MAIDLINQDDDKKKQEQQAQPQGQQPTTVTPQGPQTAESAYGGGQGGATPQGQQQTTTGAARRGGTGFTNLSRIVGANQNNRLGGAVSGGIQRTVGDVKQGLGTANQNFQQQAQANSLNTEANKAAREQVLSRYAYNANNPAAGPSDEEIANFNKFQTGAYGGPQGLENQEELIAKSQNAEALGKAAGSQEGRLNLLNRFVANKGYTSGQQRLDNLLLGQSAGGALKQARRESLGLGGQAQTAADVAQQQAQGIAGANKVFGTQTTGELGTAVDEYGNKLNQRATDVNAAYKTQYDQLQKDLASGNLTQEEADRLGFKAGDYTWNTNPLSTYANSTQSGGNFTQANVANADEAARINALKTLSGGRFIGNEDKIANQFGDLSQVGTAAKANILNEINKSKEDIQTGITSNREGVQKGGEWQGALKNVGESTAALKGIDRYQAADQKAREFNNNFTPLQQKFNNQSPEVLEAQQNAQNIDVKNTQDQINELTQRIQAGGDIKTLGQNQNDLYQLKQQLPVLQQKADQFNTDLANYKNLYGQQAAISKEHHDAEAEAAMGGGSAFWNQITHGGSVANAQQFEAQKQKDAQDLMNRLRGQQINISAGNKLPSIQDILNRR